MPSTHAFSFPGALLERGFWLYVWSVEVGGSEYLYVGRTGDSSSPFATPPYQRMGQHLGFQTSQNALRRNLTQRGIEPEKCTRFRFVAHGPLFQQTDNMAAHKVPRDVVAALEKGLAEALSMAGYEVLNTVRCRKPLDGELFARVRSAFAAEFQRLDKAL